MKHQNLKVVVVLLSFAFCLFFFYKWNSGKLRKWFDAFIIESAATLLVLGRQGIPFTHLPVCSNSETSE
jgi:hypothetical protein